MLVSLAWGISYRQNSGDGECGSGGACYGRASVPGCWRHGRSDPSYQEVWHAVSSPTRDESDGGGAPRVHRRPIPVSWRSWVGAARCTRKTVNCACIGQRQWLSSATDLVLIRPYPVLFLTHTPRRLLDQAKDTSRTMDPKTTVAAAPSRLSSQPRQRHSDKGSAAKRRPARRDPEKRRQQNIQAQMKYRE